MQLRKAHIHSSIMALLSMITVPKHNDPLCKISINIMVHPLNTKTKSE